MSDLTKQLKYWRAERPDEWKMDEFLRLAEEQERCIAKLEEELEKERMRLAACGVIALSNTRESAAKQRIMHDDYKSASLSDVIRAVDTEIEQREKIAELEEHKTYYLNYIKHHCGFDSITRLVSEHLKLKNKLSNAETVEDKAQAIRDLEQQANAIESVRKHNVRMKRKFSSQWSAGHVIENLQIEERSLRKQVKLLKGGEL